MRSIILTYPGYQSLPQGLKQLLVASESDFFSDAKPVSDLCVTGKLTQTNALRGRDFGLAGSWAGERRNAWRN